MKRMRQKFFAGGGATATISGLILASGLIIGLMMSCNKDESSKPTSPNIPVAPVYDAPSENSNSMGFYSAKGDGQYGAFVNERSEFQISVPTGEYLLTYTTTIGTFYVAFRATNASILFIGLTSGVSVSEASVQKGKIINETQRNWQSNYVTLFAWPDGPAWNGVFQSDGSAAVVLIANQSVAPGVNKLPEPQPAVMPQSTPNPQPTANPTQPNPQITVTPTVKPTYPSVNPESQLIIAEVTDPQTDVGIVITGDSQQETLIISGIKDSSGYLTSVSGVKLLSIRDNAWAYLKLGNDSLPTSVEYSDGMKGEFSNYTDKSVDVTIYDHGTKKGGPYSLPVDMNKIRQDQANLKGIGQIQDPTNPCKAKQPHRLQGFPLWLGALSSTLSNFGCFLAVDAAIASGGIAIPLAALSCGSALLEGIDLWYSFTGTTKPPIIQTLDNLDAVIQNGSLAVGCIPTDLFSMATCLFGLGKLIYDETQKAEAAGTLDTPCKQEDACSGVEAVCKKWNGMYYYYGVNDCWCNYDSGAFCTGNHPNFLSECRGISGTVSGCVAGVSYCKTK